MAEDNSPNFVNLVQSLQGVINEVAGNAILQLLLQIQRDISRSNRNNFARLMNSTITHSATPLYNLQNQLIHNFPPTAAHVRALTDAEIDALLNA